MSAHQSFVVWEPGDRNEERGEHDDVHSSCPHLNSRLEGLLERYHLVKIYHAVGETDCWHPPVEGEVGEDWCEGEEKGAKHQTAAPEISTIFKSYHKVLLYIQNCQLNDE